MYKAAIIGCGNIAGRYDEIKQDNNVYTHAGMYTSIPQFNISCASDNNEERLREFCNFWEIDKYYVDYKDMLKKEEFNIISLATPDESHSQILSDIVIYSKPDIIFTEKPLAIKPRIALEIYKSCKQNNIKLIVDYIRRWDQTHQEIKDFIKNGKIGKIKKVTGYYVRGIRHNGCQLINLIQFLFGRINCVQVIGESDKGSFVNDHSMDVRLILENQVELYMLALDKNDYDFSIFELDIFGKKGRIKIMNGGQKFEFYSPETDVLFPNFKTLINKPAWSSTYSNAMIEAGKDMLSMLNNNYNNINNSAKEAIDDLFVIEAVLQSAKSNNKLTNIMRTF
ncbi:oxidoreductase domain protein [Candidatus Magnetomorum sp. HK-1]|nr:oxidoreductase domain protein [Candidatus Magnetomorum sp. HK-1]